MIRLANKNDIGLIAKIYTDSWKKTYKGMLPDDYLDSLSYEHSEEKLLNYIGVKGQNILVSTDESNKVVAFASYKPYSEINKCLLLDSLHVSALYKGIGIGKELIFKVADFAMNEGYKSMTISVFKGNYKAENIYMHLGAKHLNEFIDSFDGISSESKTFIWEDISILKKSL